MVHPPCLPLLNHPLPYHTIPDQTTSTQVRNRKNRLAFLSSLSMLLEDYSLDGVDYNWEYPGYRCTSTYKSK